jgi:hypothetical protein
VKDLGEPRDVSRSLRNNNRAFGSHPYQTAPLPAALAARPGRGKMEKSMSPKTLQEVERAIGALTPQEVQELYVWLEQHFPQPMDARLPSDLSAGSLDTAIQRALDDEKNGRLRPL